MVFGDVIQRAGMTEARVTGVGGNRSRCTGPVTIVLGLDVGGTHSRAVLVRDGERVAEATAPSASLAAAGRRRAGESMADLLAQLELNAGASLDAVCVGTAGTGSPEADAFYIGLLSPLTAGGQVRVVNDTVLVLAAAGVADGIACVAGTGSKTVGLLGDQEERAGGWGYLLGDEGSGYWVVREAVREAGFSPGLPQAAGPAWRNCPARRQVPGRDIAAAGLVRPSFARLLGSHGTARPGLRGHLRR